MAGLERQDSQQTRAHAISALKRSASKRDPASQRHAGEEAQTRPPVSVSPQLERSGSQIAREEAMRRLEGTPPPQLPSSAALARST